MRTASPAKASKKAAELRGSLLFVTFAWFVLRLCFLQISAASLALGCCRLPDRGRHEERRHVGHAGLSPFLSLPAPNYAQLHL